MKALILFGSKSDSHVSSQITQHIQCPFEFDVISAHRNPTELEEVLRTKNYNIVIAGAGLAAHLPGVIASKVDVPVLGIPISSQFEGLDAFLSIIQMPKGVPVLASYPENINAHLGFVEKISSASIEQNKVTFLLSDLARELLSKDTLDKFRMLCEDSNVELNVISEFDGKSDELVFQAFAAEDEFIESDLIVRVPVLPIDFCGSMDSVASVFEMAKRGGLWLGVNNLQNIFHSYQRIKKGRIDEI